MKENLVSLAKLLATDDAFNLAFSSQGTDEEKYELAKTKFTDLTREDFSEFLEKLREAEKANLAELSPDELEMVAGGAGGWATKLAAAAMFVTALGATGVMSQQADAFTWTDSVSAKIMDKVVSDQDSKSVETRKQFVEGLANNPSSTEITRANFVKQLTDAGFSDDIVTKLNKNVINHQTEVSKKINMSISEAILAELADLPSYQYLDANDIDNLKSWLQRDTNEVRETLAKLKKAAADAKTEVLTEKCFEELKLPKGFSIAPTKAQEQVDNIEVQSGWKTEKITVTNKVLMHIMFGDYDEYGAFTGGGHTVKALELRNSIGNHIFEHVPNLRVNDATSQKDYYFRTFGHDPQSIEELDNGFFSCSVLQKYKEQKQIFFPEAWTWENVKQAIKETYEKSDYVPPGTTTKLTYNGTTIFICKNFDGISLHTCFTEAQESK